MNFYNSTRVTPFMFCKANNPSTLYKAVSCSQICYTKITLNALILLPPSSKHWDHRHVWPCPLTTSFFKNLDGRERISFSFVCLFFKTGFSAEPWLSWNSLCKPGCPGIHRDLPASVGMHHHPATHFVCVYVCRSEVNIGCSSSVAIHCEFFETSLVSPS